MAAFVHETAQVEPGCQLGAGVKVWRHCHLMPGCRLGDGVQLGQGCFLGRGVQVGRGSRLQNGAYLFEGVCLEEEVFIGPRVTFTNVRRPRAFLSQRGHFLPTRVGKGATLGAGSVILCGITIGRYALVGAGSVVTRDVPDYALVAGNPARQQGWVCRCGAPVQRQGMRCGACLAAGGEEAGPPCAMP